MKLHSTRKDYIATILIDCVQINIYIHSLLHTQIAIGNKIMKYYFNWIDKRIELISSDEMKMILESYD